MNLKTFLAILGLCALGLLVSWGFIKSSKDIDYLEQNGVRTIGYIYDSYYYKGRQFKYYFFVNGIKYKRSEKNDSRFSTNVGDKKVVVYNPEYPKRNRLLLHEHLTDESSLNQFQNKPIVINP